MCVCVCVGGVLYCVLLVYSVISVHCSIRYRLAVPITLCENCLVLQQHPALRAAEGSCAFGLRTWVQVLIFGRRPHWFIPGLCYLADLWPACGRKIWGGFCSLKSHMINRIHLVYYCIYVSFQDMFCSRTSPFIPSSSIILHQYTTIGKEVQGECNGNDFWTEIRTNSPTII